MLISAIGKQQQNYSARSNNNQSVNFGSVKISKSVSEMFYSMNDSYRLNARETLLVGLRRAASLDTRGFSVDLTQEDTDVVKLTTGTLNSLLAHNEKSYGQQLVRNLFGLFCLKKPNDKVILDAKNGQEKITMYVQKAGQAEAKSVEFDGNQACSDIGFFERMYNRIVRNGKDDTFAKSWLVNNSASIPEISDENQIKINLWGN